MYDSFECFILVCAPIIFTVNYSCTCTQFLTVLISCLSVLHYKSSGTPDSGGKNKEEEGAPDRGGKIMEAIDTPPSQPGAVTMFFKRIGEIQQGYLDKATPHLVARWIFLVVWFLLYEKL
ncbi:hypothetical protein AM593_06511, partial [Mytilus galloprovincialis]